MNDEIRDRQMIHRRAVGHITGQRALATRKRKWHYIPPRLAKHTRHRRTQIPVTDQQQSHATEMEPFMRRHKPTLRKIVMD
jgi:hypothetical protein